ncbi:MAG: hypothetical protein JOZ01_05075, partial [Candidatus Eremiobacteraeota bacterium]|nr:hypothetical protein [Candidatus Eremiobacteraeota bacterium]
MTTTYLTQTGSIPSARRGLHDALIHEIATASRPFAATVERLRALRGLPGSKPGCYALTETNASARPALLAALYRRLRGTLIVVVPTPDAADRAFADLLYYLGEDEPQTPALLRSRDEALGAIESPSERSARMTLLADLADGVTHIVLAPIAAVRQYLMPPELFSSLRFAVRVGDEVGWQSTQERLYLLGYARSDVVSAAGEYAVRGGILDVFAASADAPTRIEFFGDTVESIRRFNLETQRSDENIASVEVVPWTQIPRDEQFRRRILERFDGPENARRELSAYLGTQGDVPETWLPLAFETHSTIFDYVADDAVLVLDEPDMIATVAEALDQERDREQDVLLHALESGDLALDESHVGEALLADIAVPHPSMAQLGTAAAKLATLTLPGAIERPERSSWIPPVLDAFVLECRPAEHFNRQIELFARSVREAAAVGESTL